jgi:hypothetical protein
VSATVSILVIRHWIHRIAVLKVRVVRVRCASGIGVLRCIIRYLPVDAQLTQNALMVVHNGHDRVRIHPDHALEVVGLNVLRAQDERVARFLMECSKIEKLADCLSAAGGKVCIVFLQCSDARDEALRVGLTCF